VKRQQKKALIIAQKAKTNLKTSKRKSKPKTVKKKKRRIRFGYGPHKQQSLTKRWKEQAYNLKSHLRVIDWGGSAIIKLTHDIPKRGQ